MYVCVCVCVCVSECVYVLLADVVDTGRTSLGLFFGRHEGISKSCWV